MVTVMIDMTYGNQFRLILHHSRQLHYTVDN